MTTWGEFRDILVYSLAEVGIDFSDPETGELDPSYLPKYARATLWALDVFAVGHTALEKRYTITLGADGVIEMPADTLFIRGLFSEAKELWVRPVMAHPENLSTNTGMTWYEWPKGYVQTNNVSGAVWVDYYAYHPRFGGSDDNQTMLYPQWAEPGIIWLTMANILSPTAVSAANLAQYKIRVEAGDPEDNPMLLQVKHFITMYEWLIGKYPRQERQLWMGS